jgi:hypothetical protein
VRFASFLAVSSCSLFATLALSACSGDDVGVTDPPPDPTVEAGVDAPNDAPPAQTDGGADSAADAGHDSAVDAEPDAAHEASVDASIDASVDASGDSSDSGDAGADTGPEGGTVPTSCIDLAGQYQENDDVLTLVRPSCGSLTWTRAFAAVDGTPGYTHVYTTDGVSRAVTDEQGNPITEAAEVDDTAMYVLRTASGVSETQIVYWSAAPCTLLDPEGVYLTRETYDSAMNETKCEFWRYDDECPAGTDECDANPATHCETNLLSDPNDCGACGVTCGTNNGTSVACVQGVCQETCAVGFANCNGQAADGCESNLSSDAANCGACHDVCGSYGTTSATCVTSSCVIACDAQHADCDGVASDGCEVDIAQSGTSCGACGNDCHGGVCSNAQCATQGTALASGLAIPDRLQVDATYVFFADPTVGTLYAVDKMLGGAPIVVATNVVSWVAGGDGTAYVTQQATSSSPTTIARAVVGTSGLTVVATATGIVDGLLADATGAVWSDVYPSSTTTGWNGPFDATLRGWNVGDAAAHDVYTATNQPGYMTAGALAPSAVIVWVTQAGTITRVPRAGGAATLVAMSDTILEGEMAVVVGSSIVVGPSEDVDLEDNPTYVVPVAGGAAATWNRFYIDPTTTTDGVVMFEQQEDFGIGDEVYSLPVMGNVGTTPLAFALPPAGGSTTPFAVDASAVYVFDGVAKEIRRVGR